jgi:hypothetical protein
VWPLDYFKFIGEATGNEYVMRGELAWAGYSQFRGYVYEPSSTAEILPWWGEESNGVEQTWIAPRPTLQYIHNPNSQKAREEGWAWKTEEISGNKPWYNSYDDFSLDIKLLGQNYSIVPEYNISEHMDFYVNERGGNFRAENKRVFEIVGNTMPVNKSGMLQSTTENYYSYDGIVEEEKYQIEPNCAALYKNLALGVMANTNQVDINLVCPQEPPGDIDSNIRNWRCAEPYPVALLNKYLPASENPQYMVTGFGEYSTNTVTLKSENPAYTDTDVPWTPEEAWTEKGQDKVPLGFAPIPYYNTIFTDPTIKGTSTQVEGDRDVFWDQWENTFLVSFWVNLDSERINNEYIDSDGVMTKSIGGFSLKGGESYIDAQIVLDQTATQIKQFLDPNGDASMVTDVELATWFASFFTVIDQNGVEFNAIAQNIDIDNDGDVDLVDQALVPYAYYLLYREQLTLFNNINDFVGATDPTGWPIPGSPSAAAFSPDPSPSIIRWLEIQNLIQPLSLVYKGTSTAANFYLSDHTDGDGTIKYRPAWVDNIGNKLLFNIEFGQTSAFALDQWHHISLLYVGGSQSSAIDEDGIDYDSRHHRVFLWVNNQQISSEIYDPATDLDALGIDGVVNEQKYNGTLFMRNERVENEGVDSFGEALYSFKFAACDFSSPLPQGKTFEQLGYEIPQASLPGKVTDLLFLRGGEIGIEPRSNLAEQCDIITEGELQHPSFSLSYRWFFDNTLPGFVTQNMNSSLIELLSNSQCEDQNEVFQAWKDEFCVTSSSLGSATDLEQIINGNPNNFEQDDSFESTETEVTNCPALYGWWKMGIPKFEKQTAEAQVWEEDFFKLFSHTDQLKHLDKISSDHKPLGPGASKVLRLEVDAVKKLLPYNGFYPSQRAVQIGSLFYDSLAPFVEGVNDEQQWERARTEQALLQPFFSPGILFNTIKSGIAVDWAAYSGAYKVFLWQRCWK